HTHHRIFSFRTFQTTPLLLSSLSLFSLLVYSKKKVRHTHTHTHTYYTHIHHAPLRSVHQKHQSSSRNKSFPIQSSQFPFNSAFFSFWNHCCSHTSRSVDSSSTPPLPLLPT